MKLGLRGTVVAVALCTAASAQSLENAGFENWVNPWNPQGDWGTVAHGVLDKQEQDPALVYAGTSSCELLVQNVAAPAEYGLAWNFGAGLSQEEVLAATFRVRLDDVNGPAPEISLVVTADGVPLAASRLDVGAEDIWQEPQVVASVPAGAVDVEIKLVFTSAKFTSLHLDHASFRWTTSAFGTVETLPDDPYRLAAEDLIVVVDDDLAADGVGNLLQVIHRGADRTWLGDDRVLQSLPSSLVLFEERLNDTFTSFASATAAATEEPATSGAQQAVRLRFAFSGYEAVVELSADAAQEGVRFLLDELTNNVPDSIVVEARYPELRLLGDLSPGVTDNIDLPFAQGSRVYLAKGVGAIANRSAYLNKSRQANYPGDGSMQLLAYFDATAGVGVASLDGTGRPKTFGFKHTSSSDEMSLHVIQLNPFVEEAGIAPGDLAPVELFAVEGSWHSAAEHYRDWADDQSWWVKRNAAGRTVEAPAELSGDVQSPLQIPLWLDESPLTIESKYLSLNGDSPFDLGCGLTPTVEPLLLNHMQRETMVTAWNTFLAQPVTLKHSSFTRYGNWIGPYATPFSAPWIGGESALVDSWRAMAGGSGGCTVPCIVSDPTNYHIGMFAGMKWIRSRDSVSGNDCNQFWVPGFNGLVTAPGGSCVFSEDGGGGVGSLGLQIPPADQVCIEDRDGVRVVYDNQGNADWDGENSRICPLAVELGAPPHIDPTQSQNPLPPQPFAVRYLEALAEYSADRNLHVFHLDQFNGGRIGAPQPVLGGGEDTVTCYADDHGHAPGHGRWHAESVNELFRKVRLAARRKSEHTALSVEQANELFIAHLDLAYVGIQRIVDFDEGSRVVPSFQYVYGQVSPTFSRPVNLTMTGFPGQDTQPERIQLAEVFTSGSWATLKFARWQMYACGEDPSTSTAIPEPLNVVPESRGLVHAVMTAKAIAQPFYIHGKMVAAKWTSSDTDTVSIKKDGVPIQHDWPVFTASAWRSADGTQLALIYVNPWDVSRVVELPAVIDGVSPTGDVTLHAFDGIPTSVSPPVTIDYETATVTVPPSNVAVVVVDV